MSATATDGVARFARYAYPPHVRGFCGPDDEATITALAGGEPVDADPGVFAAFEGAFPYLELVATASGIGDPLDARVVDGYWLGGPTATAIDLLDVGNHLRDRFAPRLGLRWPRFADTLEAGPHPTHAFHVLGVYPWLARLRDGAVEPSLTVLDRCRIRPARILAVTGDAAEARTRPLTWENGRLGLGKPTTESVRLLPTVRPAPGDVVAAHWDWGCEILDERRLGWLLADTALALEISAHLTHAAS